MNYYVLLVLVLLAIYYYYDYLNYVHHKRSSSGVAGTVEFLREGQRKVLHYNPGSGLNIHTYDISGNAIAHDHIPEHRMNYLDWNLMLMQKNKKQ